MYYTPGEISKTPRILGNFFRKLFIPLEETEHIKFSVPFHSQLFFSFVFSLQLSLFFLLSLLPSSGENQKVKDYIPRTILPEITAICAGHYFVIARKSIGGSVETRLIV